MLSSGRADEEFKAISLLSNINLTQLASEGELLTSFFRLFSLNLSGTANNFSGWYNYFEAPIWCSGLFVLLFVPQFFHFVKGKSKLFYFILIIAVAIMAMFPYVRISVWLNLGNFYRVISLLIIVLLLYCATYAMQYMINGQKVRVKTLLITLLILLIPLILLNKKISDYASPSLFVIVVFLFAYGFILYGWQLISIKKIFSLPNHVLTSF